jgi:predicted phage-related endonuclease
MTSHKIQSREQWLELRSKNIGASEVAALFDIPLPNYALSKWSLWQILSGKSNRPEIPDGDAMLAGRTFENGIAVIIAERLDIKFKNAESTIHFYSHPRIPSFSATPDFLVIANNGEWFREHNAAGELGVMECKNVNWFEFKRSWLTNDELDPPQHVHIQLQSQMACTRTSWGVIAICAGGNQFMYYLAHREPKIISAIECAVTDFFTSITEGKEPDIDAKSSSVAVLNGLYPMDNGNKDPFDMSYDNELPELCEEYTEASKQFDIWKRAKLTYRNAICAKMRDHRSAITNGYRVNLPTVHVNSHNVEERTYRKLTVKPLLRK